MTSDPPLALMSYRSYQSLPSLALRLRDLRAGDVLLSRGIGLESSLIKTLSGGQFSHSALCTTAYTIFESDGTNVVGNKILKIIGYVHSRDEVIPLGKIPGNVARCAVYRHSQMSSVSPDQFAKALRQTMLLFYGRDYSYMCRLGRLAKANAIFRSVIRKYCDFKDRQLGKDMLPSVFCSELVGHFYAELGLSLFHDSRLPHDISPNDLASSRLELVPGVVVDPATLQNVQTADPQENSWLKALETHDPLATYNKGTLLAKVASDEFAQAMIAQNKEIFVDAFAKFNQSIDGVVTHVDQCKIFQHLGCLRRGQRLAEKWTAVAKQMPDLFTKAAHNDAAAAKSIFREIWLANRSLHRCKAILQSARLRSIAQRAGYWQRRRIRNVRKAGLDHARFMSSLDVRMRNKADEEIAKIEMTLAKEQTS
jgi:hypothetical protein